MHPRASWSRDADGEAVRCQFRQSVAVRANLGIPADHLYPGGIELRSQGATRIRRHNLMRSAPEVGWQAKLRASCGKILTEPCDAISCNELGSA